MFVIDVNIFSRTERHNAERKEETTFGSPLLICLNL